MKRCSFGNICSHPNGPLLDEGEFHKNRLTKDGLNFQCKECVWKSKREYFQKYCQNKTDKVLEACRKYSKTDKARERGHKRRARQANLPIFYPVDAWDTALEFANGRCLYCQHQFFDLFGKSELHSDHWIPLSKPQPDHPGHVPWNVIPTCSVCNLSKHNKEPQSWVSERFGRKAKTVLKRVTVYIETMKARYAE